MTVTISFDLSRRDLQYFRRAVREARQAIRDADEPDIIEAIAGAVAGIRNGMPPPDFIGRYLPELDALLAMLNDAEWRLPRPDRERLLATLVYLADPEDLIPDDTPGIGLLDDAIMIELLLRELSHVREAYRDFCRYRDEYPQRYADAHDLDVRRRRIERRRRQLHQRMRRRKARGVDRRRVRILW